MTVARAAASGDHLKLLIAMRERVANVLSDPDCPVRDISPLTRRLQELSEKISMLEERERQEVVRDRNKTTAAAWSPRAL